MLVHGRQSQLQGRASGISRSKSLDRASPSSAAVREKPLVGEERGGRHTRNGYVNSLLLKMAIEIVDFPINSMVIFHSYVKLPEA